MIAMGCVGLDLEAQRHGLAPRPRGLNGGVSHPDRTEGSRTCSIGGWWVALDHRSSGQVPNGKLVNVWCGRILVWVQCSRSFPGFNVPAADTGWHSIIVWLRAGDVTSLQSSPNGNPATSQLGEGSGFRLAARRVANRLANPSQLHRLGKRVRARCKCAVRCRH